MPGTNFDKSGVQGKLLNIIDKGSKFLFSFIIENKEAKNIVN